MKAPPGVSRVAVSARAEVIASPWGVPVWGRVKPAGPVGSGAGNCASDAWASCLIRSRSASQPAPPGRAAWMPAAASPTRPVMASIRRCASLPQSEATAPSPAMRSLPYCCSLVR